MVAIYKYGEKKYGDLLLSEGSVRIGTLYDFRRSEHKAGVADAAEGIKTMSHGIDYYNSDSPNFLDQTAIDNFGIFNSGGAENVTIQGVGLQRDVYSSDCFIHCTAHTLSKDVMSQFEGADTCVEIFRRAEFYKRLTEILNAITPVHYYGNHRITYSNKIDVWDGQGWGKNPALLKGNAYSSQCEVRAIWIPKIAKKIEPKNIADKSLIKYCRSIEVS